MTQKTLKQINKDTAITFKYLQNYYTKKHYNMTEFLQQLSSYLALTLVQVSADDKALEDNLTLADAITRGIAEEYKQEYKKLKA